MADAFYAGYAYLKQFIPQVRDGTVDVVLGTVKGDFHEIGKDLVRILLEINGFTVCDLGVDVAPESFVQAFQATHANVIGLSAFLTSARKQLAAVIDLFGKENGEKYIVVGGAAVNQSIADRIGADGYAKNAVDAVRVVKNLLNTRISV